MKLKPNSTMDLVKHLIGPSRGTHHRIMPAQLLNRRRISSSSIYISSDLQEELLTGSCQSSYWIDWGSHLHPHTSHQICKRNFKRTSYQHSYWTDGGSRFHPYTSHRTYKRNFSQDKASTVTEQEYLIFIHIHLVWPTRGTSHRIMPGQLLNIWRISFSSTYISSDLQEELLKGSCHHSYWTDGGSRLHPRTSLRTCKRNFSQDHANAVTEQTEDLVFIHVHLFGPARETSHRIMPTQLLSRWKISSSSISQEWTPFSYLVPDVDSHMVCL